MTRAARALSFCAAGAVALGASAALVRGGDEPSKPPLPQGPGLAAKYPRDAGIAKDPAVLLAEDFEEGGIADLGKRWPEVKNPEGRALSWSDDAVPGSHGKRSLKITARVPHDSGGHLFGVFPGVERAFARFHVKFPKDAGYVHHFVWMGGRNPQVRWPDPKAGLLPPGDRQFNVAIEPHGEGGRVPAPGLWNFYVYWHEMKVSARGEYWGNVLHPIEDQPVPRDRWQCVEFMVKLDPDPAGSDGELALWLDGKLVAHVAKGSRHDRWTGMGLRLLREGGDEFPGFRWRTSKDLKISNLWLEHYVTAEALRRCGVTDPPAENSVFFDDVVVSKEYVGPVAAPGEK